MLELLMFTPSFSGHNLCPENPDRRYFPSGDGVIFNGRVAEGDDAVDRFLLGDFQETLDAGVAGDGLNGKADQAGPQPQSMGAQEDILCCQKDVFRRAGCAGVGAYNDCRRSAVKDPVPPIPPPFFQSVGNAVVIVPVIKIQFRLAAPLEEGSQPGPLGNPVQPVVEIADLLTEGDHLPPGGDKGETPELAVRAGRGGDADFHEIP